MLHHGHVLPQDCFVCPNKEDFYMGLNSAPCSCSVASLGSRMHRELPFRSEDTCSLARVIDRNTYFGNF